MAVHSYITGAREIFISFRIGNTPITPSMPFTKMKLKPTFSFFFILSLLLLVSSVSHARKDLETYWEKKMKGLPMPELIKDLVLRQNQPSVSADSNSNKNLFVRDFDVKPNVIIYHSHVASEKEKNQPIAEKLFREEDKLAK